jgi:hypothetical protein
MGIFSKKENYEFIITSRYFIIDDDLYKFEVKDFISDSDRNLPTTELLNKYGFYASKYDLKFSITSEYTRYYDTLNDVPYDMSSAKELNKNEVDDAIKNLKLKLKKKFDDFRLDGSLYSAKFFMRDETQCFPPIARPKRKLINEGCKDVVSSLILEIEVLDGKSALTQNVFITFYDFLEQYALGHNIKVLVDGEASNVEKIEEYFDFVYNLKSNEM